MTRQQRKAIEREFYGYSENMKKAAADIEEHAFDSFGTDYSEPRVKASHGNTAENTVIEMISERERLWKWCKVFEKTLERFRWTQKDELMRRRYIKGESDTATCLDLYISRSTYYLWVDEILLVAFAWAKEYRLF